MGLLTYPGEKQQRVKESPDNLVSNGSSWKSSSIFGLSKDMSLHSYALLAEATWD